MVNCYKKGYRNEVRAIKRLEQLGYVCWRAKITRFAKNDFFGLFDVIAVKKGSPNVWVQVKSNRIQKKTRDEIQAFADEHFSPEHNRALIMAWKDRTRWIYWTTLESMPSVKRTLSDYLYAGVKSTIQ